MTNPPVPIETDAQRLARIGAALFGVTWQARLAELTGVNARTMSRIARAAEGGQEYPSARGVLAGLAEALEPISAEVRRYKRDSAA